MEVQPRIAATTQTKARYAPQPGTLVLRGRPLLAARVVVTSAIIFCLTYFVVNLPASYAALWRAAERVAHLSGAKAIMTPSQYAGASVALGVLVALGYIGMALVIFTQRADEVPALLAAITLVAFGLSVPGVLQAIATGVPVWDVPRAPLHALGWSLLLLFGYVFPDGRFRPDWLRWLMPLWVLWVFGFFLFAPDLTRDRPVLIGLTFVVWVAWFGTGVLARVYRYFWLAGPLERQQTKWVALGGLGAIMGVLLAAIPSVLALTFGHAGGDLGYQLLAEALVSLSAFLIPLSIVIAILRHRLFDIDVLINRTLVYGSLTALLAAVYFSSVLLLQHLAVALAGRSAGANPLILVLSTLLIAALFMPLRSRLQQTIDRRFYRAKYDAARTIERFASALRHQVELEEVRTHLLTAVEETLQPTHLSLWLRQPPHEE